MRRGLRDPVIIHSLEKMVGGCVGWAELREGGPPANIHPGLSSQRSDALRALVASLVAPRNSSIFSCSDLEGFGKRIG